MTTALDTTALAMVNLRLHILRSLLTALGIIFGVGAVIVMVSLGEGQTQAALKQIEALGAKNIIIRSKKPPEAVQAQGGQQRSWAARYGITREDLGVVSENFPDAQTLVPVKAIGSQVLREDRRQSAQAYGTTPEFLDAARLRIARGRYLTDADMVEREPVAVIGHEVAREMFPWDDPLGETLRVDQTAVRIVGILEPVGLAGGAGASLIGRDLNLDIHVPLTTASAIFGDMVMRRESGSFQAEEVEITEIYIVSPDRERVLVDAERAKRIMDARHPGLTDIQLIVPYELLENAKQRARMGRIVSAAIAGVSLLVGGIGIMNIMLATVTERTREIGVRRALGATRAHIIFQFLVETSTLSTAGGLLGVGLGVGATFAVNEFTKDLPAALVGWSIGLALVVATLTGLIAGLYPAYRAAAQDPIKALRHD